MKKKNLFLAALTAVALVGCTNDDFSGDIGGVDSQEQPNVPIVFSSAKSNVTRADLTGADAAEKLGYAFVVSGYKGSKTAIPGSIVFDNYLVEWEENSANTTESNSSNWEYVGKGLIKHAEDNGITQQTIKYWDYSQLQYDFIAWSTGSKTAIYEEPSGGIPAGSVLVSAITPATATGEEATAIAYTFQGSAADLSECYIADLVTVGKADYGDNPVTLKFRQLGTKVRIGIYETVPGYSVKDVQFYTTGEVLTDPTTQIVDNATIFSAGADIYTEGIYTVYFPTVDAPSDADNNQAHVKFDTSTGSKTTIVNWSGLDYTIRESGESETGEVYLGRSSSTASFAGNPDNNYYVVYLPNESGANLNLRINFTLESIDGSGEIIEVKNAKAQVPSIYTTWKPGFAYTYLFKISDKTNGRTGVYDPTQADDATINSDPAGLYPITFDAVVVNAEEDGTQETITTIMTPSITTYQQKSTVVNADEYTANGNNIFVTVNEGDALVTLTGKAGLYTFPAGTEAEVVDALQMQDDNADANTIKGRSGLVLTEADFTLTNTVEFGADGNAIDVEDDQALRFTPVSGKTYAFVYTKTAPNQANDVKKYQALNWEDFDANQTKYRYDYKDPATTDAQKGVKYFKEDGGVYTMVTPFIGQGVSNLYLDNAGTTIASGYAVTGTDYYYTIDGGQTYIKAHNVTWADDCLQGLYEEGTSAGTYEAPTDSEPQDGKAYYFHDTANGKYIYCVFLPEQTTGWKELDTTKYAEADETNKVEGQTYFDMYVKNDGEYYVKVIKVE
jgi:hypothetical protein